MKLHRFALAVLLAVSACALRAQDSAHPAAPAPAQETSGPSVGQAPSPRAGAYYDFTMGHIYEQQYENTSKAEYASQAIDFYKKAYALDPKSPVIGERLAEMYWKAQRIRDAVAEAQEILKRDPNDIPTRRLLARIYLRSLGDLSAGVGQSEVAGKAIDQYKEIFRLDPSDTESALWLARLYRLRNEHEKAGEVLRGILKDDPENESAVEQLTQLLLDEGKSSEAVALLEGMTNRTSSPLLFDLLGDAHTITKEMPKAERAYRKATEMDPTELSHQRGLGQTLMSEEKFPEALTVYQKLADVMPDDADIYLRIAQIYREMHQLDRAEESLLKARQYAPGNLEVMYNEAMLYQAQGRYDDAIRVLSDAIAGVKGQSAVLPSRRRSLAILYQELGQLYKDRQNYQAAIFTFIELGHLGDEEDRRARLLIMDAYRSAKATKKRKKPRTPPRYCPDNPARKCWCGPCSVPFTSARNSMTAPKSSSRKPSRWIQRTPMCCITTVICSGILVSGSTKRNLSSSAPSRKSLSMADTSIALAGFTSSRTSLPMPKPRYARPSNVRAVTPRFTLTSVTFTPNLVAPNRLPPNGRNRWRNGGARFPRRSRMTKSPSWRKN